MKIFHQFKSNPICIHWREEKNLNRKQKNNLGNKISPCKQKMAFLGDIRKSLSRHVVPIQRDEIRQKKVHGREHFHIKSHQMHQCISIIEQKKLFFLMSRLVKV